MQSEPKWYWMTSAKVQRPSSGARSELRPSPNKTTQAPPTTTEAQWDDPPVGPTILSAISRHRLVVCVAVVLVACIAVGYTLLTPKVFQATATIAMIQAEQNQALGAVATATPSQYVDSQVVLLGSEEVAQKAAAIGNATLHRHAFNASDFSGPNDSVTVSPQTTADPSSTVVVIAFNAGDPAVAQAGADALIDAYTQVLDQQIKSMVSSAMTVLNDSLKSISTQLASLSGSPQDTQLAASLVTQRTNLLNQQSQALIDEHIALSQNSPMTLAFRPSTATNHKFVKMGGLGAVIGFLVGVCMAYAIELRRTRASSSDAMHDNIPVGEPRVIPAPSARTSATAPRERPFSQQRAT